MKGVLEASEELRRAANELLPRLGAMCVLHPEDEPAFWSEEELRGSPAGMLAKRYHISTPRTHVGGGGAEAGGGKRCGLAAAAACPGCMMYLPAVPQYTFRRVYFARMRFAPLPCNVCQLLGSGTRRFFAPDVRVSSADRQHHLPLLAPSLPVLCRSPSIILRRCRSWRTPPSPTLCCCHSGMPPWPTCEVRRLRGRHGEGPGGLRALALDTWRSSMEQ